MNDYGYEDDEPFEAIVECKPCDERKTVTVYDASDEFFCHCGSRMPGAEVVVSEVA